MKRALVATPLALREPAAIPRPGGRRSPVYEAWRARSARSAALALWPDYVDAYVLAQLDSGVGNDEHGMLGAQSLDVRSYALPQGTSRSAATSRWVNRWLPWRSPRLGELFRERRVPRNPGGSASQGGLAVVSGAESRARPPAGVGSYGPGRHGFTDARSVLGGVASMPYEHMF